MVMLNEHKMHLFIHEEWTKLLGPNYGQIHGSRKVSYCCNSFEEEILNYYHIRSGDVFVESSSDDIYSWCPISLKDVAENNGWTRIEPDGSNIPKTNSEVYYKAYPNGEIYTAEGLEVFRIPDKITHFKLNEDKPLW